MCGIFGLIGIEPPDLDQMITATQILQHRGPDDWGVTTLFSTQAGSAPIGGPFNERVQVHAIAGEYSVVLGHRRLSIIDLTKAGRQPMVDSESGNWITYNGEIYNFKEIRRDLMARGVSFQSQTDTEVLLLAYRQWGPQCVDRLRGMFAFGIWDAVEQRLVLGRDRVGKKPLLYYQDETRFAFASELKALLAVPGIDRRINPAAIDEYLTYGYVPGEQTIFRAIHKVPPGHLLIWEDGKLQLQMYWDPQSTFVSAGHARQSEEVWREETRQRLEECVEARLVGDVPMGAFLSGGIDSSAVVGLMSRHMSGQLKTFSIGFREQSFNELEHARLVADHYQTDHHEFIVEPSAADLLHELAWYLDEPFADASVLPTYLLARLSREHVKVVLTGDGGDESFAGYESYLAEQYVGWYGCVPRPARRVMTSLLAHAPESTSRTAVLRRAKRFVEKAELDIAHREWRMFFPPALKHHLYSPGFREAVGTGDALDRRLRSFRESEGLDWVTRLQLWDFQVYLPDDLMVKTDRATMAHGLEARCPFLDHTLIEACAAMPPNLKVRGRTTKYILKQALEGLVPREIIHRPKQGFAVPVNGWFRGELREMAHDVLLSGRGVGRGYFQRDRVDDLIGAHGRGEADHGHKLWALLNLELWHHRYVDSPVATAAASRESVLAS